MAKFLHRVNYPSLTSKLLDYSHGTGQQKPSEQDHLEILLSAHLRLCSGKRLITAEDDVLKA